MSCSNFGFNEISNLYFFCSSDFNHSSHSKSIDDNLYLSMEIAANEMKKWLSLTNNNIDQALKHYNRGFLHSTHDEEYLRRINMVGTVLKTVDI